MTTAPKAGLEVKQVFAKAPGESGGLREGDVIVGAPNPFKSDAYHELGAAIEVAEQAKKDKDAVVDLRVMRDGKEVSLKVTVPAYGPDAKKFPPARCAMRWWPRRWSIFPNSSRATAAGNVT